MDIPQFSIEFDVLEGAAAAADFHAEIEQKKHYDGQVPTGLSLKRMFLGINPIRLRYTDQLATEGGLS